MKEIAVSELTMNPMTLLAKEWMLVTAGTMDEGFNTMTASWGHLGSLWGQNGGAPTSVLFIRPQRYTREFLDREQYYTLTFFPESCKKALAYLGAHSGRDSDKVAESGLTPIAVDGSVGFAEAKMTMVCRKLYCAPIDPKGILDPEVMEQHYPGNDYHNMYIGEILKVYVAD